MEMNGPKDRGRGAGGGGCPRKRDQQGQTSPPPPSRSPTCLGDLVTSAPFSFTVMCSSRGNSQCQGPGQGTSLVGGFPVPVADVTQYHKLGSLDSRNSFSQSGGY